MEFRSGAGLVLVPHVRVASSLPARMVGLLGCGSLPPGSGLWIQRCSSIHTWFMRFTIDAVFLDSDLRVVRRIDGLRPFSLGVGGHGARSVLEVATGWLDPDLLRKGERLVAGHRGGSGTPEAVRERNRSCA
jgi:uncharacterized membrane protein (UPF0127 family)